MHPEDREQDGGFGLSFAWMEIAELFRESQEELAATAGPCPRQRDAAFLSGTTRCLLPTGWMDLRSN